MRKLKESDVLERIFELHGNDIVILEPYVNVRTKVLARHVCGYEWKANTASLMKGHGCPNCAKNQKRTTNQFKKEVSLLVGDEYEILGEYLNKDTNILIKHNECGLEFKMTPHSFLGGQRCPNDRYIKSSFKNTIPFEEIAILMKNKTKGEYEIVGNFTATSHKADIIHRKCNRVFRNKPTRIINGGIGCPNCYKSKGEDVVEQYLIENNFDYKKQYKIAECKNKRALPFDFAIFDQGVLQFLVEYDGIQHFKPKFGKKAFESIQINDGIKNEFCLNNHIPLIRIKYNRSENPKTFKERIYEQIESKFDMSIPSQA